MRNRARRRRRNDRRARGNGAAAPGVVDVPPVGDARLALRLVRRLRGGSGRDVSADATVGIAVSVRGGRSRGMGAACPECRAWHGESGDLGGIGGVHVRRIASIAEIEAMSI